MSTEEKTWAERARRVSDLTPEACAAAIKRSRPVYDQREKEPGGLTIDQVASLNREYNDEGKAILREYLDSVFG